MTTSIRPGISDEFLSAAGVEVLAEGAYSLRIPYYDWQGKPTLHNRWRLRTPLSDQKYYQEPESGSHLYFCHLPLAPAPRLYLSEGEFKCLALREEGLPACGLPGLHCYTHDDPEFPPILLPGIFEALQVTNCLRVCFIGDADTLTNLEYFRSAGVLAQGIPPETGVELLQIPLGGPKGVDDLRGSCNGQFADWLRQAEKEAFLIDPKKSFLLSAALCLEARGTAIHELSPTEREHHIARIVRMAVGARLSKEDSLAIERFCTIAQKISKLTKDVFTKAVEAQIRSLKAEMGEEEEVAGYNSKIAYYEAIQPWPVERPLSDIVLEARDITRQFVITDLRHTLLTACWAAHTYTFEQSAYLPLLVFTGAEEDSGKSTYMRVVGRMCCRSYLLVATLSIHRVLQVYRGTFLLDESKQLSENKDLISFINSGFDNISQHPVDCPILPRYDMESGQLLEFDPRFPKACAGIGTFLERDTLSRSLVIKMERYLLAESRQVKEYLHCTDEVTLPIYQAFLKYWTDERKILFGQKCRTVIHQFPEEFRSRRRLKFVPLLAVAEMGGPALYEETMEAAKWMHNAPDTGSPALTHQLLCDVARVFYRQILLLHLKVLDPVTGKPSAALRQPTTGSYLLPTTKLIELLHLLPEAPWKSYGREKRTLNANGLFEMLGAYGLAHTQQKISGVRYRGLDYKLFHEKYGRYCRVGDPTLKSIAEELDRDLDSPDDPPDPSSGPTDPPAGPPSSTSTTPSFSSTTGTDVDIPSSELNSPDSNSHSYNKIGRMGTSQAIKSEREENQKSAGTACTADTNTSTSTTCSVPALSRDTVFSKTAGTGQVAVNEVLTQAVPAVPALFPVSAPLVPLTTPAAGFCIATHPERFVGVDLETFYPWAPEGEISAKERKRRKEGKAHTYAKDPRRNLIRLLSINTGTEILVYDLLNETVPDEIRDLLRTSTLIIHNADFDVTVLRRHGFEVSSSIFDTMLASQLLRLGEVEPKLKRRKQKLEVPEESYEFEEWGEENEELEEFEQIYVPVSNDLPAVVKWFLGIEMEKIGSKLGGSDWSVPNLSAAQLDYARDDVTHFQALRIKLTEELRLTNQWGNFRERSEFLVHLNNVKFAGIPVDKELVLTDKAASEELVATTKAELREMFTDYRPLVPKTRCDKKKKKKAKFQGVINGAAVFHATPQTEEIPETEEINPGYHVHIKAALAAHGIWVENTKKVTLSAIDTPETRGFCRYKEQTKLLTIIKGIEKSIFHDGRVRSAQWNQLEARSGRIIPREPNVQQLPRNWRKPFRAIAPQLWLKMDLTQIEIYILAIHCQCPYLIDLLQQGKDVYVLIAAEIFGKMAVRGEGGDEVSDTLRDTTKTLVLGISYCLGLGSFIRRVEIATRPSFGVQGTLYSMGEAREFYAKFFEMFPEVKFYQDKCFEEALTEDFVYTVTGQRRYLPPLITDEEPNGYWPSRSYRHHVLVNTPVQGGAACHYIRSINKLVPRLRPTVELVHLIHDEVGLLVTQETAQATIEAVTLSFQEAFAEIFGTQLTVKLEPQLSDSWAKLPKVKV